MLSFTNVYFFESGLFNGLQPIQIKKVTPKPPFDFPLPRSPWARRIWRRPSLFNGLGAKTRHKIKILPLAPQLDIAYLFDPSFVGGGLAPLMTARIGFSRAHRLGRMGREPQMRERKEASGFLRGAKSWRPRGLKECRGEAPPHMARTDLGPCEKRTGASPSCPAGSISQR